MDNQDNNSFAERLKQSVRTILDREVSSFQNFEQEYKISSHPLKRTFIAIGKLNQIHRGKLALIEIANESNLPIQDIEFIVQEFIDQRLIEGYIEKNGTNYLILRQKSYLCQIDQNEHDLFELKMQCQQCLRFICLECYYQASSNSCIFCKGHLIPVPKIFKVDDVHTSATALKPSKMKFSLSNYYKKQKETLSNQGIKQTSGTVWEDLKSLRKNWPDSWSFASIKEKGQNYFEFRKFENKVSRNEKKIIDTISGIYLIEECNAIPLYRIAKLVNLDLRFTHEIITRLISQQTINGFIETEGTYDSIEDDVLVLGSSNFYCEIHDESHKEPIPISSEHFQCSGCFRTVCTSCFSTMKNQGVISCLFCDSNLIFFPKSN
ncbi:hypothetical protein [Candidatus Hodarchaeum mangrovi]